MINNYKIFDCTLREVGYQTGWHYDSDFIRAVYKFAQGKGIDYVELGFFHNMEADPNRGLCRYCSQRNDELKQVFREMKNITKLSAMRDIQRPLSPLLPKTQSIIDTIRILTRSHETQLDLLETYVEEAKNLDYEVFLNFTSSGYNTMDKNRKFLEFAARKKVTGVEFADTESVMTKEYVKETIKIAKELKVPCGIHFHDKNGTAEQLADLAILLKADYVDVTHLGLGGKWRDGNLTMEYLLRKFNVNGGYEATVIKNRMIEQLIKYNEYSAAE